MEGQLIPRISAEEIRPNLWLGDMEDAVTLAAKGFTPLCVLEQLPWSEPKNAYWVPILTPSRGIISMLGWETGADKASHEQLDVVALVIDNLLASGHKVILHCAAGVERSPLAMVWYLMKKEGLTVDEAYDEVRRKRPIIADRRLWLRRKGHDYLGALFGSLERWTP